MLLLLLAWLLGWVAVLPLCRRLCGRLDWLALLLGFAFPLTLLVVWNDRAGVERALRQRRG